MKRAGRALSSNNTVLRCPPSSNNQRQPERHGQEDGLDISQRKHSIMSHDENSCEEYDGSNKTDRPLTRAHAHSHSHSGAKWYLRVEIKPGAQHMCFALSPLCSLVKRRKKVHVCSIPFQAQPWVGQSSEEKKCSQERTETSKTLLHIEPLGSRFTPL